MTPIHRKITTWDQLFDAIEYLQSGALPKKNQSDFNGGIIFREVMNKSRDEIHEWINTRLLEHYPHRAEHWLVIIREMLRMVYVYDLPEDNQFCIFRSPHTPRSEFLPSFGHISETSTKWAYTESWEKGLKDIQTPIKQGRYLRKFKSESSDEDIKRMVALLNSRGLEVKIVWDDRTEWRRVYENGPSSCMTKSLACFGLHPNDPHPVEVYARKGNGVGLAYVENALGDIGARTIITDSFKWVRIYKSDAMARAGTTLREWLEKNNYRHDTRALDGRELDRYESKNDGIICPYIDHDNMEVDDQGDYLYVNAGIGNYQADHSTGRLEIPDRVTCADCGSHHHEDDNYYSEYHEQDIGPCCIDDYRYAYYGRHCGETYVHEDSCIEVNGDYYVNEPDILRHHDIHQVEGEYYHIDDLAWDDYDEEYIHENDAITLYDNQTTHKNNAVRLHSDDFAHKDDDNLVRLHNGEYAITTEDSVVRFPDHDELYLEDELERVA